MKRISSLLLPLVMLVFAAPVKAQQPEVQWLTVYAEHVPISNQAAFEEVSRDYISLMSEAGISDVAWVTVQSQRLGYAYVTPGGPAEMSGLNARWGAAMAALGDRGTDLMAKGEELVSSRDMYFLGLRPDLSYLPERVPITADMPYRHYTQLFVHPSMVEEFEASLPGWISMYRDTGVEYGFRVYQYMTGADLPAYLVVQAAKNEAEFYGRQAELEARLGDRMQELRGKMGPTLRRAEDSGGWVRPELSFGAGN